MLAAALLALSVTATAAPDRLLSQPGPVITLAPELDVRRLADGLWLHVAYLDARHGMATNGLLVETPAGPVLLDTGWNETQGARLLDWAERSFRRPVVAVIVTHAHQDRI